MSHPQPAGGARFVAGPRGAFQDQHDLGARIGVDQAWIAAASRAAAPARSRHHPSGREPTTLAPSTTIRVTAATVRSPASPRRSARGVVDDRRSSTGRPIGRRTRRGERAGSRRAYSLEHTRSRRAVPAPEEAEVLRVAARAAEDAGDFRGALRLVRRLPEAGPTWRWMRQLETVIELPEDDPQRSVWLVHPAVRWARERPAGRAAGALRAAAAGDPRPARPGARDSSCRGSRRPIRWCSTRACSTAACSPATSTRRSIRGCSRAPARSPTGRSSRRRSGASSGAARRRSPAVRPVVAGACVCTSLAGGECCVEPGHADLRPPGAGAGRVGWAFALPPVRVDQRCAVRLLRARRRGARAARSGYAPWPGFAGARDVQSAGGGMRVGLPLRACSALQLAYPFLDIVRRSAAARPKAPGIRSP